MAIRDLSLIDEKNFRQTAVPLQVDTIKEFFENKNLFFLIDYGTSQIKGSMFLTYLSNLDLPCEISFVGASLEDKFQLIKVYMETRNINSSDILKLVVAELILTYKKFDTTPFFRKSIFTVEEKNEFISQNIDIFKKWDQFLCSSMMYYILSNKGLNDILKSETQFREINDPLWIGLNVVNLYGLPGFTEMFFSTPLQEEILYFKPHFEDYMFKGKNFFYYFGCAENTLLHVMNASIAGDINPAELIRFVRSPDEVST